MPKLYSALKASYGDTRQTKKLLRNGFIEDTEFSNKNEKTFYNPTSKKLLYTVAGTHSVKDIGTDIALAFGALKSTDRYKNADKNYKSVQKKYVGYEKTLVGHSLGSPIVSGISSAQDKVYTLDGGFTLGSKKRKNTTNYRTSGDVISVFAPKAITLKNPNAKTGLFPIDALNSHNVSNIQKEKIFV
jgi:hypothetical protein